MDDSQGTGDLGGRVTNLYRNKIRASPLLPVPGLLAPPALPHLPFTMCNSARLPPFTRTHRTPTHAVQVGRWTLVASCMVVRTACCNSPCCMRSWAGQA